MDKEINPFKWDELRELPSWMFIKPTNILAKSPMRKEVITKDRCLYSYRFKANKISWFYLGQFCNEE